ncbi:MAG: NAD-binding protein [Chloroflexi bacterium]|nr:NAD-binding protein [Chloroflexota bacterium]
MARQVGCIGVGVMGRGLAQNCLKAGFEVTVFDQSSAAVEALVAQGARAVGSPREVAAACDAIILCLPSSPHVEAVCLGPDGLIEAIQSGAVVVDCTTCSPLTSRKVAAELKRKDAYFVDAGMTTSQRTDRRPEPSGPGISHAVGAALGGNLLLLMGGEKEAIAKVQDVLDAISLEQRHFGDVGAGEVVKLGSNVLTAIFVAAYCEVLVWAAKQGVDAQLVVDAYRNGTANSVVLGNHIDKFAVKRRFEPGIFPVDYMYKDVDLTLSAARAIQCPMPVTSLIFQFLESARAQGEGGTYHPVVLKVFEQLAGGVQVGRGTED